MMYKMSIVVVVSIEICLRAKYKGEQSTDHVALHLLQLREEKSQPSQFCRQSLWLNEWCRVA